MLHRTVDIYVHVLNAMSGPSWAAQLLPEQDLGDAGAGGRHHLPRVPPHQRAGPGQAQEAAAVQLQSVRIPPPVYCVYYPLVSGARAGVDEERVTWSLASPLAVTAFRVRQFNRKTFTQRYVCW